MKRLFFFLVIILASLSSVFAQKGGEYTGTLEVAFGRVRNLDGTWRNIKGLRLPYKAERIRAVPMSQLSHGTHPQPNPLPTAVTVYNCDSGGQYGYVEEPDPSSLDDITMSGGANIPWFHLTFGVNIGAQRDLLMRWRIYGSFIQGQGHGNSAFVSEIDDFGVIYPATQPGTYKITINVAAAGVVCPTESVYMAQQWRHPRPWPIPEDGEGPFDEDMRNVYNPEAAPTTGSSENMYWYDSDPLDGIYSEDEVENFGEGIFANHLRTITVNGTQDTLFPSAINLAQGTYISGTATDAWHSDDEYYRATANYNVPRNVAPLQIVVDSVAQSTTAVSLRIRVESGTTGGGAVQKVELFNYQTNVYDTVMTTNLTGIDQTSEMVMTSNPSKYIKPASPNLRQVRARISITPAIDAARTWAARLDRCVWMVIR